jgi:hypothetical protein
MADTLTTDIRTHDKAGSLIASGVNWSEERAWATGSVLTLLFLLAILEMLVLVVLAVARNGIVLSIFIAIGLVMFGLWRLAMSVGRRRRELVFHADGRMTAPLGLPGYERYREIPGDHAHVSSIEMNKVHTEHTVEMYWQNGHTTIVAHHLTDWQARKIAVSLSNALRGLRESMTTMNRAAAPAARVKEGRRPAAMVIE